MQVGLRRGTPRSTGTPVAAVLALSFFACNAVLDIDPPQLRQESDASSTDAAGAGGALGALGQAGSPGTLGDGGASGAAGQSGSGGTLGESGASGSGGASGVTGAGGAGGSTPKDGGVCQWDCAGCRVTSTSCCRETPCECAVTPDCFPLDRTACTVSGEQRVLRARSTITVCMLGVQCEVRTCTCNCL